MPIGKHKLKKSMRKFDDIKANVIKEFPGELGLTIGGSQIVEIPTRPGFVYVRLRSNLNEVIQAYNDKVANVYGLKVKVARDKVDKSRWYVVGKDTGIYQDWGGSAYLPNHHEKHEFNPAGPGNDIVWTYSQQFMPFLIYPSGSSALYYAHPYYDGSDWNYSGLQLIPSLSGYKPTGSNARVVLVYIDSDDTPMLSAGSYLAESSTGTADIIGALPALPSSNSKPLAAIRLLSGTSTLSWGNIYDIRQFFGGGGGGSGADEKAKVSSNDTTAGYLNGKLVAGAGITLTENNDGGNETLTISSTGAVGGGGISGLAIYEDSIFKATGTAISFNDNLNVSVTGTTVFVAAIGGGSGSSTEYYWDVDLPPTSVNDKNDEFNDASVSGWIELDEDGELTTSEDDYGLKLYYVYNDQGYLTALLKSIPAGSFTVTTKVIPLYYKHAAVYAGLVLANASSGISADFIGLFGVMNITNFDVTIEAASWPNLYRSGVISSSPSPTITNRLGRGPFYFRIIYDSENAQTLFQISSDGKSWTNLFEDVWGSLPISPSHMGLAIQSEDSGSARFEFFRVENSAVSEDQPVKGRKIKIPS
jgi:hypothetical protein